LWRGDFCVNLGMEGYFRTRGERWFPQGLNKGRIGCGGAGASRSRAPGSGGEGRRPGPKNHPPTPNPTPPHPPPRPPAAAQADAPPGTRTRRLVRPHSRIRRSSLRRQTRCRAKRPVWIPLTARSPHRVIDSGRSAGLSGLRLLVPHRSTHRHQIYDLSQPPVTQKQLCL